MRLLAILAAGTAAILAVGAPAQAANRGGFYIHDAALAAKTDAADAAIQGADADKPFTDQLATLKADAAKEDLAVARFYVAWRDRELADVIAAPSAPPMTGRSAPRRSRQAPPTRAMAGTADVSQWEALNGRVCRRLEVLLGKGACDLDKAAILQGLVKSPENYDRLRLAARQATAGAQSWRLAYEAITPEKLRAPDDCDTLLTGTAPAGHELGLTWSQCNDAARATETAAKSVGDVLPLAPAGKLRRAYRVVYPAPATANEATLDGGEAPPTPKAIETINAEIRAAETAARNPGWIGDLRKHVLESLNGLSYAAQAARWKQVKDDLDAMRQAIVCGSGSSPSGADGAADDACAAIKPFSTAGRARAVWVALEAVNQLQQAGESDRRSVRWLTAARAVASAEEDDANLRAADDEAKLANARLILFARLRESADLAQARLTLASWTDSRAPYGLSRALPLYAASWNEGRIPAEVYAYHDIQRFRATSVLRAQAILDRQQILVKSASASLKAYGDAGFTQDEISKVFQDAVLLGIAVK